VTKAEEYPQKAVELEEEADKTPDPAIAQRYRDIARQWHELAERAELHGW
jgi:hypothetical protein